MALAQRSEADELRGITQEFLSGQDAEETQAEDLRRWAGAARQPGRPRTLPWPALCR